AVVIAIDVIVHGLDFHRLFIIVDGKDVDSATMADVLDVLVGGRPDQIVGKEVDERGNTNRLANEAAHDEQAVHNKVARPVLLPGAPPEHLCSRKSSGSVLERHLDNAVINDDGCTLVLRKREGSGKAVLYRVDKKAPNTPGDPPQPEDGDWD